MTLLADVEFMSGVGEVFLGRVGFIRSSFSSLREFRFFALTFLLLVFLLALLFFLLLLLFLQLPLFESCFAILERIHVLPCVVVFVVAFPADKVACFAVVHLLVDYFLDFINFVLLFLAVILLFEVFFFIGRRICVLLFLEKSVDFALGQVFCWLPGIVFGAETNPSDEILGALSALLLNVEQLFNFKFAIGIRLILIFLFSLAKGFPLWCSCSFGR